MTTARLGDVLLRMGVISATQLDQAMALQARHKARLGQIVVDHGFASEERMMEALAEVSSVPRLDLSSIAVDAAASRWITKEWAEQQMTLPISVDRIARTLTVAISDPTHVAPLDELAFRTGLKINPVLGSDRELLMLHRHVFHGTPLSRGKKAAPKPGGVVLEDVPDVGTGDLLYGMDAVRDHMNQAAVEPLYGVALEKTEDASFAPRLRSLMEAQQDAARELQVLFELCVSMGIIQRADYLARLQRQDA